MFTVLVLGFFGGWGSVCVTGVQTEGLAYIQPLSSTLNPKYLLFKILNLEEMYVGTDTSHNAYAKMCKIS